MKKDLIIEVLVVLVVAVLAIIGWAKYFETKSNYEELCEENAKLIVDYQCYIDDMEDYLGNFD